MLKCKEQKNGGRKMKCLRGPGRVVKGNKISSIHVIGVTGEI
jgi:hypothetical protein